MDLLLHIGCEKTGTTALQDWLDRHDGRLAARHIVYSRALGRPNNRALSYYGMPPGTRDESLRRDGITTAAQHADIQHRIAADIAAEAAAARAAGCKLFVASNEHCHSRLKTSDSVVRVHALLAPLFDSMRVVCLLRPQIDTCLSLASTLARSGNPITRAWIDRQMRPRATYYALDQMLARWAGPFGPDQVQPAAFARHPDSIAWFAALLGVDPARLPRATKADKTAANGAIDWRLMALTNALAAAGATGHGARFFINEFPLEQRLTLDRASAQALQSRFAAANAALCADWPQIAPADLEPDWARYPPTGTIDQLDALDSFGPMLRQLIDRLRAETLFERARLLAMTAERDLALGDTAAALRACRAALPLARQAAATEAYRRRMQNLIDELEDRERTLSALPVKAG